MRFSFMPSSQRLEKGGLIEKNEQYCIFFDNILGSENDCSGGICNADKAAVPQ